MNQQPFSAWKLLHLSLDDEMQPLEADPDSGGAFVVFWLRGVPVGHQFLPRAQLPLEPSQVRDLAERILSTRQQEPELDRANSSETQSSSRDPVSPESTSVVICTRDRPVLLARCLDSLERQSTPPGEIIVVDNAPKSDATRQLLANRPQVRYVLEPKPGLSAARNRGIQAAGGTTIAFTDDDIKLHSGWIDGLCRGFDSPDVMLVTGLTLPEAIDTEAQLAFELRWSFARGYEPRWFDSKFFRETKRSPCPVWSIGGGGNCAVRRSAFELLGGFDERLGAGAAGCSEDSELFYRVLAAGQICRYEPSAVAFHTHRGEQDELNRQLYSYMRGHVAALLVQFEKHGHFGNLRRILFTLPGQYAQSTVKSLFAAPSPTQWERTLKSEIFGCAAGVTYYLGTRWRRTHSQPTLRSQHNSDRIDGTCVTSPETTEVSP